MEDKLSKGVLECHSLGTNSICRKSQPMLRYCFATALHVTVSSFWGSATLTIHPVSLSQQLHLPLLSRIDSIQKKASEGNPSNSVTFVVAIS